PRADTLSGRGTILLQAIAQQIPLLSRLTLIIEMVYHLYYTSKRFAYEPSPNTRAQITAKSMASWNNFNKFNDFYKLDVKKRTCGCKYLIKLGYYSHQLTLKKLLENDEFVNEQKKSRPKLAGNWLSSNRF
ncbi:hypothetical protein BpHYR1_011524, partial [Brachionus plicatilis]